MLQVCLVLIFMIYVFEVPARGPMVWIVTLTLMQGLCGMAFGLIISALCDNEQVRLRPQQRKYCNCRVDFGL